MSQSHERFADAAGNAATTAGMKANAVGWRKLFSAFRHRNYRLFFAGQFVSLIGNWVNSAADAGR